MLLTRYGALVLAALMLGLTAMAERHAFIVGNSNYEYASRLVNPGRDAQDMAQALEGLGYHVTYGADLSRNEMLRQFQDFTRALGEDDLALVYYAGHGLQMGGENYIVPVDARLVDENQAKQVLVSLNSLLTDLSRSTRNRIIILDACRNNPFLEEIARTMLVRGDAPVGLARVFSGVGSYIAFSTQPGNVALDGQGANSPFAKALLTHIGAAGMDVHAVMRRVRADVQMETQATQIPWESSSLIEDVVFAPHAPVIEVVDTGGAKPIAVKTIEAPEPVEMVDYHYVDGLDPDGDNFLALREGYTPGSLRLATMESGTLLEVVEEQGVWRRVILSDGSEGWAHSNWIACCKTLPRTHVPPTVTLAAPEPAPLSENDASCDRLWHARNAIWHRHKYCFGSERGKTAFGNAGCSRNQSQAFAAMGDEDRTAIDDYVARETELGCR